MIYVKLFLCNCKVNVRAVKKLNSQDVILGILMQESISGYDIKHKFETVFSYFYNASYGTIYPTLSKMEKDGLITKVSIVQEGKPNKNVYTITKEGKESFHQYMYSEIQENEMKSDFLVRLHFGELAEQGLVIHWLETGLRKAEEDLKRIKADEERCKPFMSPTQEICIEIGITNKENVLRILKDKLSNLKSTEA
jgi:DNA-binding PadR family transcriptional regulator